MFRSPWGILAFLFVIVIIGYGFYAFGGAQARMKELCREITPGMQFSELKRLSLKRGVTAPTSTTGINYLVERKSFGRWGCVVIMDNGLVKSSEYNFAD